MEKFTTHTGIGVPLRQSNVDTDQIIPAVYLKRITRTGFEDALFAAWRKDESFILNQAPFNAGSGDPRLIPSCRRPPLIRSVAAASSAMYSGFS